MLIKLPVSAAASAALADFQSVTTIPVQWGDQDAFGHVNNVVYFRWFESSRADLLNCFSSAVTIDGRGLGPILASVSCSYRKQLRFPDVVQIGSRITRIGRSSFDAGHAVFSEQQQALVAEGVSTLVVFNYDTNVPVRIPPDLRAQFEDILPSA